MIGSKVFKTNAVAEGLIERITSILDEIKSKNVNKEENGDDRGNRGKAMNTVKPFKNINTNLEFSRNTL